MNRKYTRQLFLETVERLKKHDPDFTFTTDIIVGFPGETEADFHDTLNVMRDVKFAKVHMFPYSERKRTLAALYPNKVPQEVIQKRKQIVLHEAEQQAFTLRQNFVGRTMKVLTENDGSGHTENFLNVIVSHEPNQIVTVFCESNAPEGLIGRVI